MKLLPSASAFLFALLPLALQAKPEFAAVFTDNMVLQRDQPVAVFGSADAGEKIMVSFGKHKAETAANDEGDWHLHLPASAVSAKGQVLAAHGSGVRVECKNVVVGEVWVASGQSNMQWSVDKSADSEKEIAAAKHPNLRIFQVAMTTASEPASDVTSTSKGWQQVSPETIKNFTAVGYYFAREVQAQLGKNVPVGIIQSAWGGTRAEAWTSRETLLTVPAMGQTLVDWKLKQLMFDPKKAGEVYKKKLAAWDAQVAKIKEANSKLEKGKQPQRLPRKPSVETEPVTQRHHPSALYNAMIAPLRDYGIRGAIWYQGESNASRAAQYSTLFPAMITDWREQWGKDFPFYFVQLANFRQAADKPGVEDVWAELQWSQFLTQKNLKNTGMAVINDIGMEKNIHPTNKQDVGKRLAMLALKNDYGKKQLVAAGPVYKGIKGEGGKIRVHFDNAKGLKAKDGKSLARFEIAGEDQTWHWADAKIDGETVVVSHKSLKKPVAVRYAWCSNPTGANLTNASGIPASLFRSDNWKLKTEGVDTPFSDAALARPPLKPVPPVKKESAPAKPEAQKPEAKPAPAPKKETPAPKEPKKAPDKKAEEKAPAPKAPAKKAEEKEEVKKEDAPAKKEEAKEKPKKKGSAKNKKKQGKGQKKDQPEKQRASNPLAEKKDEKKKE